MKLKSVYATQYGAWWLLTPAQWRKLLHQAIVEGGHQLNVGRRLQARPRFIAKYGNERPHYWSPRKDILIVEPLDWNQEHYENALEELTELTQGETT